MFTLKFQVGNYEFTFESSVLFTNRFSFKNEKELKKEWTKSKRRMEMKMKDSLNVMKVGEEIYFLPRNEEDEQLEKEWFLIDGMRRAYQIELEERHTRTHERRFRISQMAEIRIVDDRAKYNPRQDLTIMPKAILKITTTERIESNLGEDQIIDHSQSTSSGIHLISFNVGNNHHAFESGLGHRPTHYSFDDNQDLEHKRERKMHIWKYKMEEKNMMAVKSGRSEDRYWTEEDFELEREIWILEEINNTFIARTRVMHQTQRHRKMKREKKSKSNIG